MSDAPLESRWFKMSPRPTSGADVYGLLGLLLLGIVGMIGGLAVYDHLPAPSASAHDGRRIVFGIFAFCALSGYLLALVRFVTGHKKKLERSPLEISRGHLRYTPEQSTGPVTIDLAAVNSIERPAEQVLLLVTETASHRLLSREFADKDALTNLESAIWAALRAGGADQHRLAEMQARRRAAEAIAARPTLATRTLLVLLGIVAVIEVAWPAFGNVARLIQLGGNTPVLIREGQVWRLLSAAFLHVNILHFVFNATALWAFGIVLERLIGSRRLVTVFVLSAVGGNLLSFCFGRHGVSVGASSAIFGLMGALLVIQLRFARHVPASFRLSKQAWARLLFLNGALSLLPQVDLMAHLGGLLAGATYTGLAMSAHILAALHDGRRSRIAFRAATLTASVCLLLALANAMNWPLRLSLPTTGVELRRLALPGFSLRLPDGAVTEQSTNYRGGHLVLVDTVEDGGRVQVAWQAGTPSRERLTELAQTLLPEKFSAARATYRTITSGASAPIEAVSLAVQASEDVADIGVLACGARTLIVASEGRRSMHALFEEMLSSISCLPDENLERDLLGR